MRVDTVGKSSFHNKKNWDTLFPHRLLSRVLNSNKQSEPFYHVGSEWTNVCFKFLCRLQGLLLGTQVTLRAPWSWSEQCQIPHQERSPLRGFPPKSMFAVKAAKFFVFKRTFMYFRTPTYCGCKLFISNMACVYDFDPLLPLDATRTLIRPVSYWRAFDLWLANDILWWNIWAPSVATGWVEKEQSSGIQRCWDKMRWG